VATIQGAAATTATPYTGPLVTRVTDASVGELVTVSGSTLGSVTKVEIDGVQVLVTNSTATGFSFRLPAGITPGSKTLKVFSSFGVMSVQGALVVRQTASNQQATKSQWTKIISDNKVKIYSKNPVGAGKVQFLRDGKEIAWIRAVDETDPKLSLASGTPYLVRTVSLNPGKNRFEIRINGQRAWRATYVPRD
jgi:hypothetical protein